MATRFLSLLMMLTRSFNAEDAPIQSGIQSLILSLTTNPSTLGLTISTIWALRLIGSIFLQLMGTKFRLRQMMLILWFRNTVNHLYLSLLSLKLPQRQRPRTMTTIGYAMSRWRWTSFLHSFVRWVLPLRCTWSCQYEWYSPWGSYLCSNPHQQTSSRLSRDYDWRFQLALWCPWRRRFTFLHC